MSFRLAHISDVHLGPLPRVRATELIGKRLTGYVNWQRNRRRGMASDTLDNLVKSLNAHNPDHIAITGDLINIGLEAEIEFARQWLNENFDAQSTSLVPGNHDAYIRGTLAKALSQWAPYMSDDKKGSLDTNADFPFMRVRGNVALIGASSAVATPAFVAAGRFGASQADRLSAALADARKQGLFRVVMIHHPPIRGATIPRKRLYGIGIFSKTIREQGAELVLHGHTHLPQRHTLTGPDGATVPVIGVPSASQTIGGKKPASAYNLFEIAGDANNWQCNMREFSLSNSTGLFAVTDERRLLE